ncbi:MAG TPA: histidine kinase dimerization/phospho-acceptor domain-containing protein, partial [Candidatus Saccharimonadales bacterium]|nr:histidine kinase dimerization/phospho-acceptor domain-containing protein [Candidatus Saccharimonadales bacterium]
MFKSATVRLTAWYALIIMFISILFSVSLYEVSLHELDDRLHQQMVFLLPRVPKIRAEIISQHNLGSHALLVDLVYFNLIVLVAATTASYLLARQTLEPIEEAHEMQTRFAADASHELRTPLTAMKSEIEVALRDGKLPLSEYQRLLTSNLEEVDRLVTLTNVL